MKPIKIIALVLIALASSMMLFRLPQKFLIIAFMAWSACLFAEEKITLKAPLILLYMPVCFLLAPTLLIVLVALVMAMTTSGAGSSEEAIGMVAVTIVAIAVLLDFGLFDFLLALRHRKKKRLISPAYIICTALAFIIRLGLILMIFMTWLSFSDPTDFDAIAAQLTPQQGEGLLMQIRIIISTLYLPSLGIILSPSAEPDSI